MDPGPRPGWLGQHSVNVQRRLPLSRWSLDGLRALPRNPRLSESTLSRQFLLLLPSFSWFWLQPCAPHLWQREDTLASSKRFLLRGNSSHRGVRLWEARGAPPGFHLGWFTLPARAFPSRASPPVPGEALGSSGLVPAQPAAAVGAGARAGPGVPACAPHRPPARSAPGARPPSRRHAGRAADTHAAGSACRARSSPAASRAPRACPCAPASCPRRCEEVHRPETLRGRRARCSRPSARPWGGRFLLFPLPSLFIPGKAGPSPWLPLT